ncbi:DUF4124 domain-containing protein [Uliginosibacterium sediminicola]|uniref:DUF4124 domain-containing protein n=1 Tax=Uliginosibacterium sediminicola TaxID=2024550 RepID=A0ABU9YVM7_9RHOO
MSVRTLIALLSMLLAASAGAQIYSWKDASGRMHFSDQPPPDNTTPIKAPPSKGPKYAPLSSSAPAASPVANATQSAPKADAQSAPAAQSGPKSWADKDLEYKQRKAAEQEAAAKKKAADAQAEEKKRYCESLRNNQAMLGNNNLRVARANSSGQADVMDSAQRQQEAERLSQQLARDCK